MRAIRLMTALAVTALATASGAQTKAPRQPSPPTKTIIFGPDQITGELRAPTGESFVVLGGSKHSSLIRIRRDYIAEIVRSAEDLR